MCQACGKTGRHRIGAGGGRDDRDRMRGLLRDRHDPWSPIGDDDVDGQPDQVGSHRRQSAVIPVAEPILDLDVRALDIAELA